MKQRCAKSWCCFCMNGYCLFLHSDSNSGFHYNYCQRKPVQPVRRYLKEVGDNKTRAVERFLAAHPQIYFSVEEIAEAVDATLSYTRSILSNFLKGKVLSRRIPTERTRKEYRWKMAEDDIQ